MQTVRKPFGWGFGFVSLLILIGSILRLCSTLIRRHGALHPGLILVFGVTVALALVFGMAWWTTWKAKPSARAWGIASSLVFLLVPVSEMYFAHQPMNNLHWSEIAIGVFSLAAYAWPDRERESPFDHHLGVDGSAE